MVSKGLELTQKEIEGKRGYKNLPVPQCRKAFIIFLMNDLIIIRLDFLIIKLERRMEIICIGEGDDGQQNGENDRKVFFVA